MCARRPPPDSPWQVPLGPEPQRPVVSTPEARSLAREELVSSAHLELRLDLQGTAPCRAGSSVPEAAMSGGVIHVLPGPPVVTDTLWKQMVC